MFERLLSRVSKAFPKQTYAVFNSLPHMIKIPGRRLFLLTGYEEIESVFKQNHLFVTDRTLANVEFFKAYDQHPLLDNPYPGLPGSPRSILQTQMAMTDGTSHQKQRNLVQSYFTKNALIKIEAEVQRRANLAIKELISTAGANSVDVVESLCCPFPFDIIAHIVGLDSKQTPEIRTWSDKLPILMDSLKPMEDRLDTLPHFAAFATHILKEVEYRKSNPREDLLTLLSSNKELTPSEQVALVTFLFTAGHETTSNWLSALLEFGHYWWNPILRATETNAGNLEESLKAAIWEVLRLAPAVQHTVRISNQDQLLNGRKLRTGDLLVLHLGAASHDTRRFKEPSVFKLDRKERFRLAFGHGVHHCVGAALAEIEARAFVRALENQVKGWTVQSRTMKSSSFLRSYSSLHIRFEPKMDPVGYGNTDGFRTVA